MRKFIYILLLFCMILPVPVFGQKDTIEIHYEVADTVKKNLKLFESDELLELSLRFDITTFRRKKSAEEYLPAVLTCYLSKTDSIKKEISLKARGQTRRTICSFPPIRINFKKPGASNDEFSNINKLKMVTHCEPGNQIYTLKEYLIYKLYNVLTDYSYRVRLAKINYINTAGKNKQFTEYAFFIEPTENLGKRVNGVEVKTVKMTPVNGVEVKTANLTQKNIRPEIMDRMAIFNYMIGNTDWSVPIYHNVTILSPGLPEYANLGIIVPFDFDYSGLINADYAVPFDGLGLKSVLERRYLGICRSPEIFNKDLKEFSDKKEEFFKVINEFPYLNAKTKKEMIVYMGSFFKDIDKQNTIMSKLRTECINF